VAGVRSVAISNVALLSNGVNSTNIVVQGRPYAQDQHDSINRLAISAGYFETMEMPMRMGRGFTERDSQTSQKVAVINETAARKYFANENPIGQRFGSSPETAGQLEIVGVLRDAKYDKVRGEVPPTMYVPFLQTRMPSALFQVRTAGDPLATVGAIREAVRAIDSNLPLMNVSTQVEQVEKVLEQERLLAKAYALFGALALLIASIGLFGLMSYSVARRTNEIGIRMALGADRGNVLGLMLRGALAQLGLGLGIGIPAALAGGRVLAGHLYGVKGHDPMILGLAAVILAACAVLAVSVPARRATRVDPIVALRYE
jgi:predicted permease